MGLVREGGTGQYLPQQKKRTLPQNHREQNQSEPHQTQTTARNCWEIISVELNTHRSQFPRRKRAFVSLLLLSDPGQSPSCSGDGCDTHPVRVVDNKWIWVAIVGWIGIRVIAEPGKHGCYVGHVLQYIPWNVSNPFR